MNLLCWLFGIHCRAKKTTRRRFTSTSGVVTGNAEFDRLPSHIQIMLDELDLVDVDNLTLDQLEQVRQELLNGNALVAALRLTYLIRDRLDGDYLAQVAKNVETHTHLQNLIDAQLAAVDASPAHHPETGTDGGIV